MFCSPTANEHLLIDTRHDLYDGANDEDHDP